MGKTTKTYKGKKHTAKDRKRWKDKKYFGETSGTHSKSDNPQPKKGEQFVKYGWPLELRKGKVIKNLQKEREADEQIKEIKK